MVDPTVTVLALSENELAILSSFALCGVASMTQQVNEIPEDEGVLEQYKALQTRIEFEVNRVFNT